MENQKILIVDDDSNICELLRMYLQKDGFDTAIASDGEQAVELAAQYNPDLILLDINLGDGSGFDVCKVVREKYKLPILFISARQSDDDVLIALSIGGDDYIKKPYSLAVLLAKVKINLKKIEELKKIAADAGSGKNQEDSPAFALDDATMSVIMADKRISLKAKEFALLKCLYNHKNTIVTKDELFAQVWGDAFYSDGTLNVHIRKLREKLEEDPNEPKIIKTIWGTGYILEEPTL